MTDWLQNIPQSNPWYDRIIALETVESTNTLAKKLAKEGAKHGTVVIADGQTGGRGRLGRQFQSPGGLGIYMSVILRYPTGPEKLMHLTCAAGVSICQALTAAFGIKAQIKWTNDIIVENRKLGGILTELVITGRETCAIVGIGLNCRQKPTDFSAEIREIAVSLSQILDFDISPPAVFAAIVHYLQETDARMLSDKEALLKEYRERCITLGKEVSLVCGDQVSYGRALDIDGDGALTVQFSDGSVRTVNAGEVSVRGMYGYIR